ncbi:hypothetical protein [Hahella ganghwensis]|uniref:hypothetical protein n=1 Tax=Hahella ganghwensis TaxID=286420 RepID=UPI00036F14D8|nr:hypothetical protein [Hahella ganghwensis]
MIPKMSAQDYARKKRDKLIAQIEKTKNTSGLAQQYYQAELDTLQRYLKRFS